MLMIGISVLLIGLFVGGIAYSGYTSVKAKEAGKPNYNREQLVINDLNSILQD